MTIEAFFHCAEPSLSQTMETKTMETSTDTVTSALRLPERRPPSPASAEEEFSTHSVSLPDMSSNALKSEQGGSFGFSLKPRIRCSTPTHVAVANGPPIGKSCYSPPHPPHRDFVRGVDLRSEPPTDSVFLEVNTGRSILDRPLLLSEISSSRKALYEDTEVNKCNVCPRVGDGLVAVLPPSFPDFPTSSTFPASDLEDDMPTVIPPIKLPVRVARARSPTAPRRSGRLPVLAFAPIQHRGDDQDEDEED